MGNNQKIIRVAVIGGGPSGWSAVRALENANKPDKKFEITIFEKENRWGGKCCTVTPQGATTNSSVEESPGTLKTNVDKKNYEMGAVIVAGTFSNPTENYAELLSYIKELGFSTSLAKHCNRQDYVFYKNGQEVNPLSLGTILRNICMLLKAKYDLWRNYTSNTLEYKDILARYPLLTQHLSQRYPNQAVLEALGYVVQGFGYADQDDPYLAPPLLYFLDSIKSEHESAPLHSVDQGMQGVWSDTAERYRQRVHQRLGETVVKIQRDSLGATIKTNKNKSRDRFDKLVIATPLIQAQQFMDYSEQEQMFLSQVKYNHYVSVLCKVELEKDGLGLINVPNMVDRSKLGQVVFAYKPYSDSPWMVVYLYIPEGTKLSDEKIVNQVSRNLKEDMNATLVDKKSVIIRHWEDYFAHLDKKGLESGWYDRFEEDFQNDKHTLYVGTPLHMETVGHAVRYAIHVIHKASQLWTGDQ